jgi:hypothetical protein
LLSASSNASLRAAGDVVPVWRFNLAVEVVMRVRSVVLMGCFVLSACELNPHVQRQQSNDVESRRDGLVSYVSKGAPTGGIADGPVVAAKLVDYWGIYVRRNTVSQIVDCDMESIGSDGGVGGCLWYVPNALESESFLGRPSAVAVDGLRTTIFVHRTTGPLGYDLHYGGGEFGAAAWNVSWYEIPGGTVVSGNPAASSWGSPSTGIRYDVFGRTSAGYVAWVTGTSPSYTSSTWTPPTWGSWSTDTAITLLAGTDPGAVSVTSGRIDLFACDSSHNLMWKSYWDSTGTWTSWSFVVSGCYSTPSAAGYQSGSGMFQFTYWKVATLNSAQQHQVVGGNFAPISPLFWDSSWTQLSSASLSSPSLQRTLGGYRVWGKASDGNAYYANF